ncbi:PREDICTED: BTB/POZ domain-containing protein KCTD9 [Nicrophorus vespilloides]|uniref:BTB/POZ domain-containing protein KCTD9 n=1 Tax=Nicrophorus vespilloides TaxID=110193 RepID=A0ABM1MDK7_NICVS|nr:PREDICTED: BTB/POZ domain-containing protein KCTD9 [Nicrophorus vespilloides]
MMSERRVTVFKNGTCTDGKVFVVPKKRLELCMKVFEAFKCSSVNDMKIFNEAGSEIMDLEAIRDNEAVYFDGDMDAKFKPINSDWVTLNVGGKVFMLTQSTLTAEQGSMLARMFAKRSSTGCQFIPSRTDANGAYLIDRNPTYFEPILNFLRTGKLIYDHHVNPKGILEEAIFFGIDSIVPTLEQMIQRVEIDRDDTPLTRRDVILSLTTCATKTELRFQGVNLAGADLSRLDLSYINFKYANMKGCNLKNANLSWCCLERADLSYATIDGAQLLGIQGLCANLEGAQMRNCKFDVRQGIKTNMEGVNLKGANMEGSDMVGVNLRVATLKNANLKMCDLKGAVLAGADLENCDLSGSDLHEANLRGANLKDAAFELLLTPLHMSQTIR